MKKILLLFIISTLINSFTLIAQNYGLWREIDSMNVPRVGHAIVELPNGNILVSGNDIDTSRAGSEIFSIDLNIWNFTTPMNVPRSIHKSIKLVTGNILVVGGLFEKSCELFDPNEQSWRLTDSIFYSRNWGGFTLTDLKDGKILLTGGLNQDSIGGQFIFRSECEIYDPLIERWVEIANMNIGRGYHSAILLDDGKVLVIGGETNDSTTNTCELYDPKQNQWHFVASMNENRSRQASIRLKNGNVFVSGGRNDNAPILKSCEVYNPTLNMWEYGQNMMIYRVDHKIYYHPEENKLIIFGGGMLSFGEDTWEIYDPDSLKPNYYEPFPIKQLLQNNNIQITNGNIFVAGGWEYEFNPLPYFWPSKRCWIFDTTTEVDEAIINVKNFQLFQNYPNPFNPVTTIGYNLKEQSKVELKIFDILGNEVITLVDDILQAGYHQAEFNSNNLEEGLSSGIYIYQIKARGLGESKTYWQKSNKMILLK